MELPITEEELLLWKMEYGDLASSAKSFHTLYQQQFPDAHPMDVNTLMIEWVNKICARYPEHVRFSEIMWHATVHVYVCGLHVGGWQHHVLTGYEPNSFLNN